MICANLLTSNLMLKKTFLWNLNTALKCEKSSYSFYLYNFNIITKHFCDIYSSTKPKIKNKMKVYTSMLSDIQFHLIQKYYGSITLTYLSILYTLL